MRGLERNKVLFYYVLYLGKVIVRDEYGNESGYRVIYSKPIACKANISPAKGGASIQLFGSDLEYDKVIVLDDTSCPIDENTVLFIDRDPKYDADGNPLFDYIVRRVARSLNSVSIAISRAEVS